MTTIEDNMPHEVAEVICLKCLHRWIAVYPTSTLLKNLECKCGEIGYVIKTGQTVEDMTDKECDTCTLYVNKRCKLGLSNSDGYDCGYYKSESEDKQ